MASATFIYGLSSILLINSDDEFFYSIFEIYLFTSATFLLINKTNYRYIFKGNPFLWFPKIFYDLLIILNIFLRKKKAFYTNVVDLELDKATQELKKLIVSQVDKKETRFADYLIGNKRDKISYLRRGEKEISFAIPKSVLERYKKISSEIDEQRNIVQSKTENHDESASEIEKLKFNPELIEIETISGTFKKFDKEEKPIFNFVI